MKIFLRVLQGLVFICACRFRIVVAGRRFGKTELALVATVHAAWGPGRVVWYVGPTYKQVKRIAWNRLKELTRPYWARQPNETDLSIELRGGGTIALRGADNYDSLRGIGLDFVVLDEFASMSPAVWTEILRPALSDRNGGAFFIGTPRGYDHFYDLFQAAQGREDWATFQFTTEQGGNVAVTELEQASDEMDERTWRQEFQASFENSGEGLVYYAFDRGQNVQSLDYDPQYPLCVSFDFNVNPMCLVIGQNIGDEIHVLDEMILMQSNTLEACEQLLEKTESLALKYGTLNVYVYGDATGDSRHSSADKTDWHIVHKCFARYVDQFRVEFRVPSQNPLVKARVNAVNSMLRTHSGQRRLLVDPKCQGLIKDFERVRWKSDSHGNLQKDLDKSEILRTHVSDALGYWVVRDHPLRNVGGFMGGPRIL